MKTKYASSPTIEGIEWCINNFYCSTTFKVDKDTLQVSNKNGIVLGVSVEFKKGRYMFGL